MNPTWSLAACPTCKGSGVQGNERLSTVCTTCAGQGMWIEVNGSRLSIGIPALINPLSAEEARAQRIVRYGLGWTSFLVTIGSLLAILFTQVNTPLDLIWHGDWYHALFGLSGLISMYTLSHFNRHQTSMRSLGELDNLLVQPNQRIDALAYSNPRVEEVIRLAAASARQLRTHIVTEEIFLYTLLMQGRILGILGRLEEPAEQVIAAARSRLSAGNEPHTGQVQLDPKVREILYQAFGFAHTNHFPYVDLEDILLAFTQLDGPGKDILAQYSLTQKEVFALSRWYADEQERERQWLFWSDRSRSRPKGFMNRSWTALPTPYLDQFSKDITVLAAEGRLASSGVRDTEIERALEVLSGTQENNVIFLGEPGVGKNTILSTIALRMAEERVPEPLKDKRLVQVDLAALLTSGDHAEQNVQAVIEEVAQAGNVILAIPEVQTLAHTSNNALDAASILSNALNQGMIQIISSATYADYHKYVESNSALKNLVTIIEVKPTTPEQTLKVLEEETPTIENQHKVLLTFHAMEKAVELAERYITDKVLPLSALSLLKDAASATQTQKQRWVTKEMVEVALEKRTGVPIRDVDDTERTRLLNLETSLHSRVIGQEVAVTAVANALRRSRTGFHTSKRPIASFLFVGPTGVGKTELAKALADTYFGSAETFVRLDMSEYQDERSAYRMIGAPAADSESMTEGGDLTKAAREHPYSLILLDEIEKAHPDVLNLFLQLLDDGRLTENTGRTVSFQNCIIVATSNAAAPELGKLMAEGIKPEELSKQALVLLSQHFKPEFLNRFDGVIPFHPLTPAEIIQVTNLLLTPVIEAVALQGIVITLTPEAIQKLADLGYDPAFGARPLRRTIQDKLEGMLAEMLLNKQIQKGDTLQITPEMIQ